jgi:hypothetical protein
MITAFAFTALALAMSAAYCAWLAMPPAEVRAQRAHNRKLEKLYRENMRHRRAMRRARRARR